MSIAEHTGIIVLAAGSSSRLGKPKQLLEFKNEPLLQKVINECEPIEFGSRVIVLGANSDIIQRSVKPGLFTYLINEKWMEGIASSIRKGAAYSIEMNPNIEHLLFLLSDQPFVSTELLENILQTHETDRKEITASHYRGDVGVPALFSNKVFPLLANLKGDQGAKKIMKGFPEKVNSVRFKMGHFDVDTPEDYAELRKLES